MEGVASKSYADPDRLATQTFALNATSKDLIFVSLICLGL